MSLTHSSLPLVQVNTYFYLALGATEMDLGWVGFLRSLGGVFCAPVYGWVLDKYGAATAICLTSFSCAAGCLIRGKQSLLILLQSFYLQC